MYEYEIVPVLVTRGAGGATAKDEWRELQETLNRYGRLGFRVVAVTEGQEGRAVIMERRQDPEATQFESSVAQAAAEITLESSRDAR